MKNYISIFIVIVMILSSCKGKEKMGFNDRDDLNMQIADKIVECINNTDVIGLYNLFSEEVKNNDLTLKEDIKKLYRYLNGQVKTYEKWAIATTTDMEKGQNSTCYRSKFKLKIDDITYFMYYDNTVKNDFSSEQVGLKFIKIFPLADEDKYFCYWQDIKPGIFLINEAK